MPGGRPTDYDPAFCEKVVEWGALGKSIAWMAAELDVSRQSIYEWASVHPEFSDAIARAKEKAQKWWEDAGQANMLMAPGAGTFNGSVWSRSMAARFPDDWREKTETALTGANGGPVQIVATEHDQSI